MIFDIRTMAMLTGIVHLFQAVIIYYQYKVVKSIPGIGLWVLWSLAEVIGFLLFFFRDIPGLHTIIIILQNSAYILGTVFVYLGVSRFLGRRANIPLLVWSFSAFLVGFCKFIFIRDDIRIRGIIIAFALAFYALLIARELLRNPIPEIRSSVRLNLVICSIHGLIFLTRGILMSFGIGDSGIYGTSFLSVLPYIDALVVGVSWTIGFVLMVNQRLYAEMKLSKEEIEQYFHVNPDAVIITRASDGKVVMVNQGFCTYTRYSMDDVINKSTLELGLWKNLRDRDEVVRRSQNPPYCENYEAVFVRADGTEFYGLLSARPITLHGAPHILSITRDITDRKLMEERIQNYSIELEKTNAAKDKFFSIISHDLRGPVHTMSMMTELMNEAALVNDTAAVNNFGKETNIMLKAYAKLLENLLTWSRLQRGKMECKPIRLMLAQTIDEDIYFLKEEAAKKGITIVNSIEKNMPVYADENMLRSVIQNLLNNAIKFSNADSSVQLSAVRREPFIEITVKDGGVGVDPLMVNDLFDISKVKSTRGTNNEKGAGLGLILCRNMIEMHGGTIWVNNNPGKGAAFTFTLRQEQS